MVPDTHCGLTVTERFLIPQTDSQLKRSRAVQCAYAKLYGHLPQIQPINRSKQTWTHTIPRHAGASTNTRGTRALGVASPHQSRQRLTQTVQSKCKEYAHRTNQPLSLAANRSPYKWLRISFQQSNRPWQQTTTAGHKELPSRRFGTCFHAGDCSSTRYFTLYNGLTVQPGLGRISRNRRRIAKRRRASFNDLDNPVTRCVQRDA